MFEFTEAITVSASASAAWNLMTDLEEWWVASNPEHISLERLDDLGIAAGARIRVKERIAGIPGEYVGELTRVVPGREVTMEAPKACYRFLGVPLTVGEGVTWRVEAVDAEAIELSARVWATFPAGRLGRGLEWGFTHLLDGIAKDREHARTELRYLKRRIEAS